jgi:hypothetical protein
MYAPVAQPCHVESVIAMLPTGPSGVLERWKYSRYFDNDQFWSSPGKQDVMTIISGRMDQPGTKVATTTVKDAPVADQFEVYNVTADPTEMTNLADDPRWASIVSQLAGMLVEQRRAKRLTPTAV